MSINLLAISKSRLLIILSVTIGFCTTNAFGSFYRQLPRITISANNIPLELVFKKINSQTGVTVNNNYKETKLDEKKRVTINFQKADINEVMTFLLNDKKDLSYVISGNSILIFKRTSLNARATNMSSANDTITEVVQITGKIVDKDGKPIPGATIKLKFGNKRGTISSEDGSFRLSNLIKGSLIVISSIGFESKEILAENRNIIVQLNSHFNLLDEKVIIAYGSTTKRLNTGNVSSLKAVDIENQPVNNPMIALQGRVPGITIQQANGLPGSGVTVRIQGQNSINGGNDPFYVIDGVPYISQLLPMNNTIGGNPIAGVANGSPLNYMNLGDIESIEILKDADATAIYGSRAANGAVLITTKKGKSGPVRINATYQNGWSRVARKMDVLNTKEYLLMRHEAIANDGVAISPSDFDLNGTWDTTRDVNWQKELIGNTAQYNDAQLGISGGNAFTQFMIGAGYHRETTVFPGDFSYKKGNIHFNINSNSANQKFKVQLTGSYITDINKLPINDLTSFALTLAPVAPDPYNPDGSINWAPKPNGSTTYYRNPIAPNIQNSINKTDNLIANGIISYELIPGLTIKSSFGYNKLTTKETTKSPKNVFYPELRQYVSNGTQFLTNLNNSWIIEPQVEYNKKFNKGKLTALLGSSISQQNSDQQNIQADGFSNELVMEDLSSATRLRGSNINSVYKYNALYSRITYNWLDKYIINLTARRDGSSRFGSENQFHNFGAIGTAWIFTQEKFSQSVLPFLSFGKLRGSFGTTGNDQIGEYQFMDIYQSVFITGNPYQNVIGLEPTRITNPYLQWEETKKLQIGLELGFMKDKILFTINYNQNRSSNQLASSALPTITGFSGITRNIPAVVQNTGWEFTLATINIKTKNFYWGTNFNLTVPKNKLLSYFGQDKNNSIAIGRPLSIRSLYKYIGVNDTTGVYQFQDAKGNPTSEPSDPADRLVIFDLDPKYYGGLQNTFSYKEFSLDFFFLFTKKISQDNSTFAQSNIVYPGVFYSGGGNQSTTVLNRWQKPGDKAKLQPYSTDLFSNTSYISNSDAVYTDASFLKLKNISFSWQLPQQWKSKLKIQNGRLFLNAQNIFTITRFNALDPETGLSLPPLRTLTIGAQITL